jgi:hypothetical protein
MSESPQPGDAEIVAYLDGELAPDERAAFVTRLEAEPELLARLTALDRSGTGIADAMAELKARAPKPRLDDIFAQALAEHGAASAGEGPIRTSPQAKLSTRQLIAASICLVLLGGIASEYLRSPQLPPGGQSVESAETRQSEDWLQAVAEYWVLTTEDTLALQRSAEQAAAQLEHASDKLGINLVDVPERLTGLSFRGVQLFSFNGKPLVQMAFLDPEHGPIAYCVISDAGSGEIPRTTETLEGFTIVHWARDGQARLLIGRAPVARLEALAERALD